MEEPRMCYKIRRLRGDFRDDYLLIRVHPPVIGQKYGLGDRDIDKLIVATRHKGASLYPISGWPVFVHVARILVNDPESRDILHAGEIEETAWAELYRTEESARAKLK